MLTTFDLDDYVFGALEAGAVVQAKSTNRASDKRLGSLSEREREALVCMAEGLSNVQLAERLFVSEATIKTHVSNVLTKLQLHSRGASGHLHL